MNKLVLLILTGVISVCLTGSPCRGKAATSNTAVDALFPQQDNTAQSQLNEGSSGHKLPNSPESPKTLAKRLDIIETRLGSTTRQSSPAATIERRLADIEKRLDRLEQQYNRIQQMEQRIRKMEAQRY